MNASCFALFLSVLAAEPDLATNRPFGIEVVDEQTGRGVPLVELRTVNQVRLYTDSHGLAAFNEPGLMNETVFFQVNSHGYEMEKDGFGFRGKALKTQPGGGAKLSVRRINIAERLYRVTGEGIYRDSVLLGRPAPIRRPLLNAKVLGSDSVVAAVYEGKIHWFWGDTNRPGYPLGNFHVPGATSLLPEAGGLDPELGVDLEYQVGEDGFARPAARMPGDGPTWIDGLIVLKDPSEHERMFAFYAKIRNMLDVYERGLAEYDGKAQRFVKVMTLPRDLAVIPSGHPFTRRRGDDDYVYFASPYPLVRVRATPEDLRHPDRYEAFTCLVAGSRLDHPQIDRSSNGSVRYTWKPNTPPVLPAEQAKLIKAGILKPDEALLAMQDAETGSSVFAHAGSVYWNDYRKRWVMITAEAGGTSFLGETWFAEADTPLGPWVYAKKVVTHAKYDFYNPKQHPMFAKQGGQVIFFEGTYTNTFSGNPEATPRYEYNQIMYKLDLANSRLNLPVPVYQVEGEEGFATSPAAREKSKLPHVPFFALEKPGQGTVPVFVGRGPKGEPRLVLGEKDAAAKKPVFHAFPPDVKDPPKTTVPLYEVLGADGEFKGYSTDSIGGEPGSHRAEAPLCRVWRNPMKMLISQE